MMFAWSHFLSLAAKLLNSANVTDSEIRTSVGRAYYAAYCSTRDKAVALGLSYSGKKPSHEQVWQFMRSGGLASNTSDHAACKHVGDLGVALRAMRTQADYFLANPPTEADAQKAVAMSTELLKRLAKL
ncbi:MAG TPA: hypothetical protein VMF51_06695 [Nocardioides sp.]|uniref:hypothetical protein n=1 Tax=Nocardioides sp. TaxID=35761 RepID=UPI002C7CC362|nr:hypothetical protein [Nocardioides sp.]HTW14799.1 hypothetical protein [Nocardioides sp.]